MQRAEVEVEGWVWMVKYGASRGAPLSTTLLDEAAVVSTLLVPKLLKGPPPPINPSNGSCPSLSPQEPAGQRKGLSAESKERWVLDIVASTEVP